MMMKLADPSDADRLREAGILYAPDYVINAGGLINVSDELQGYNPARAKSRVENIYRNVREIFQIARERHMSAAASADEFARERMEKIGRVRLYWVPGGRGWAKIWGRT